jgi:thiol peroxidase
MVTATRTVTIHGKPYTLEGPEIKAGQKAPDFTLTWTDFSEITLSQSKGKVRLLSVVHSLDTGVCDLQTQWFEEEAGEFPQVVIYTISMDLPFAQARYCGSKAIKNLKTLSDYKFASFGKDYGVLIQGLRLLSRAVFIIDANDIVRYVEYVPEVSQAPNYDAAIAALKQTLAG